MAVKKTPKVAEPETVPEPEPMRPLDRKDLPLMRSTAMIEIDELDIEEVIKGLTIIEKMAEGHAKCGKKILRPCNPRCICYAEEIASALMEILMEGGNAENAVDFINREADKLLVKKQRLM